MSARCPDDTGPSKRTGTDQRWPWPTVRRAKTSDARNMSDGIERVRVELSDIHIWFEGLVHTPVHRGFFCHTPFGYEYCTYSHNFATALGLCSHAQLPGGISSQLLSGSEGGYSPFAVPGSQLRGPRSPRLSGAPCALATCHRAACLTTSPASPSWRGTHQPGLA